MLQGANCSSEGEIGAPRSNLLLKEAIKSFGTGKLVFQRRKLVLGGRKRLFAEAIFLQKGRKRLLRGTKLL